MVDLDEKEEKLLNVALNKIKGQWDYSRLEEIFQEYELEEAKVTGFTGQEIALILAKNDDVEDPAAWQDDEEDEEEEKVVNGNCDCNSDILGGCKGNENCVCNNPCKVNMDCNCDCKGTTSPVERVTPTLPVCPVSPMIGGFGFFF